MAHKSAAAARQYYTEGLKREDYYTEKQEVVGNWHGKAAERMGLSGNVTSDAFAALVENRHPVDGGRLTPHTKSDRIVGYDLNFHAPKSLSVLYAMTLDKGVLKAFRQAVQETMVEIEESTATRVRKRGESSNRVTGNLAWAEFVHFTARPVGGIQTRICIVHCFAFQCHFRRGGEALEGGEVSRHQTERTLQRSGVSFPSGGGACGARIFHPADKAGLGNQGDACQCACQVFKAHRSNRAAGA
ncbi:MAG: relaxase domain-containing protein [Verrucomicrobiaceae bacterium]|nr:relaxase domain-containing protein [Verrucomicrobiaceae bacterium]